VNGDELISHLGQWIDDVGEQYTYVVHTAGTQVQHRTFVRQRCAWCGELLLSVDLMQFPILIGQDGSSGIPIQTYVLGSPVRKYENGNVEAGNECDIATCASEHDG
jgi:hypothetical protein